MQNPVSRTLVAADPGCRVFVSSSNLKGIVMDEVRSEHIRNTILNRWNAQEADVENSDVSHVLTDEGSIDSFTTNRKATCDCGCVHAAGGICSLCNGIICRACFCRCVCGRPLGPCHAIETHDGTGKVQKLCPACYGASRRRQVMRLFLSPFVRFKD